MSRGAERLIPHTGTETRTRLLREAAVRNIGQWRVEEEGPMGCKLLLAGSNKGGAPPDESTGGISIG